ncbi:hypothetical protein LOK49_LG12G00431 [Camellia lanceoleosa]|uniref:Uncharacterized protein n=1 Tax=Camellia lanceoleosa TaxID=1840588 RepID=A0ACC0FUB9_9ERIC|nr:hypothetical protein LOK49_LG12G00431 [Camellia lanceoleosa]
MRSYTASFGASIWTETSISSSQEMYFRQNKEGGTFRLVQFQSSDEAEQLYGALMRCRHLNLAHVLQFTVFLWDFDLSKAKLDIVSSLRDRSLALGQMQKKSILEDCKMQLTLELRRARGDEMVRLEHLAFVILSVKLENIVRISNDNKKRDVELLESEKQHLTRALDP